MNCRFLIVALIMMVVSGCCGKVDTKIRNIRVVSFWQGVQSQMQLWKGNQLMLSFELGDVWTGEYLKVEGLGTLQVKQKGIQIYEVEVVEGQEYQSIVVDQQKQWHWVGDQAMQSPPLLKADISEFMVVGLVNTTFPIMFQVQSTNCYECLYWNITTLQPLQPFQTSGLIMNNTAFPILVRVTDYQSSSTVLVQKQWQLQQNHRYVFYIWQDLNKVMQVSLLIRGDNKLSIEQRHYLMPFLMWLSVTVVMCLCTRLLYLYKYPPRPQEVKTTRLLSLDCFRGFNISMMIFVNLGGGGYWFCNHSFYNGLTFADLIYPWFIFIMGTTLAITLKTEHIVNRLNDLLTKALLRTMKLVLLGLFVINNGYDLANWRLPGVLQRIAFTYIVFTLILLFCPPFCPTPNIPEQPLLQFNSQHQVESSSVSQTQPPSKIDLREITYNWKVYLVCHIILLVFIVITYCIPFGDCPAGYNGPGGISQEGHYMNCGGGIANYIDQKVFTTSHIFNNPFCKQTYGVGYQDPEGLLGSLCAVYVVFMGYQMGSIIKLYSSNPKRLVGRVMLWAIFYGLIAGLLCGFTQEGGLIPINKNVWSLSYSLLTGALGMLVFLLCYLVIDVFHWSVGWPFVYMGMNSIIIYVAHEVFALYFPFAYKNDGSHSSLMISNLIAVFFCNIIAFILYQKSIFFKL